MHQFPHTRRQHHPSDCLRFLPLSFTNNIHHSFSCVGRLHDLELLIANDVVEQLGPETELVVSLCVPTRRLVKAAH